MKVRIHVRTTLAAALLCGSSLIGCGAGSDAMAKDLAALRTEVTALRASASALTERLDSLEMKAGALAVVAPPPAAEPAAEKHPELPVVRLTPEARVETVDGPPPQTGPRVRIKSTPNGLVQEETGDDLPPVEIAKPKPKPKTDPPKGTADKKPEKR